MASAILGHGQMKFLGEKNEELAAYATELARDERRRLEIARAARRHVEQLGDLNTLWEKQRRLFARPGGKW